VNGVLEGELWIIKVDVCIIGDEQKVHTVAG
jgi:hypothetical protein